MISDLGLLLMLGLLRETSSIRLKFICTNPGTSFNTGNRQTFPAPSGGSGIFVVAGSIDFSLQIGLAFFFLSLCSRSHIFGLVHVAASLVYV